MTICVEDISKTFRGRSIWRDISFSVDTGSATAITGSSGSGKTTLLNCVGTLERPDSGDIRIDGKDLATAKRRQRRMLRRDHLGFLFQNSGLVDMWNVDANLEIALTYSGLSRRERTSAKRIALERVGLTLTGTEPAHVLSGGQRQRVALARLMLKRPSIVLADEPTASLDEANALRALDVLNELRQAGATILVSTHDRRVVAWADGHLAIPEGAGGS